jgi:hypothetical protein
VSGWVLSEIPRATSELSVTTSSERSSINHQRPKRSHFCSKSVCRKPSMKLSSSLRRRRRAQESRRVNVGDMQHGANAEK